MIGLIRGGSVYVTLTLFVFYVIAVLSALILHELAHGLVAYWCGDPSAKYAGRLSLNPFKHLDPLGTLSFLLFGFGWTIPVPINPNNFRHPRRDSFLVSIAGIVTNLLVAFVASFFFVLLAINGSIWAFLFQYMLLINLVFAVFNLLPLAPLDGFNLIASLSPNSGYVRFLNQNRLLAMVILLVIIYFTDLLGYAQEWLCNLFIDFWCLIL